jgi:uncharacterized surface protein with fasciclin (FAS1) repeats
VRIVPLRRVVVGAVAGVVVSLSGCADVSPASSPATGSPEPTAAATTPPTPMPVETPTAAVPTITGAFGPACAAVPAEGPGSLASMATRPIVTAAAENPALDVLVAAVESAGLADTLNGAEEITLFAPGNDAFAKLDPAVLDAALADPRGQLTTLLTYHIVPGTVAPEALAGEHTTLHGDKLAVAGSGQDFTINDVAKVVCGNVQTDNATVYVIDRVLMPAA